MASACRSDKVSLHLGVPLRLPGGAARAEFRAHVTEAGKGKEIMQELLKKVGNKRNTLTSLRLTERTKAWVDTLQNNWKSNGAKAFFKYLRNDQKIPKKSF